jgi:hypothetical protein
MDGKLLISYFPCQQAIVNMREILWSVNVFFMSESGDL